MMTQFLLTAAVTGCGLFVLSAEQMPVAQQNAMVQKYCAVCHTDASMNGGISFEHFDAAHVDPGDAAMMVSKLKGKALGASGQPLPDRAVQDALQNALAAEAAGAGAWTANREGNMLTASVVQEAPSTKNDGAPDLYRLKLTCRLDTDKAGVQLTWAPGVPEQGRAMLVGADEKAPVTYKVEGLEKNGNGMAGTSGPGAATLRLAVLPAKTLTVSHLFGDSGV